MLVWEYMYTLLCMFDKYIMGYDSVRVLHLDMCLDVFI
jgi:hypothetical protein